MVRFGTFFKVMALVAIMFGVSYNADAQLLGGLAKAVKNKNQQSHQNKACAMPQPDAKAKSATFSVGKNGEVAVCSWNPATLEITMLDEIAGNKKGDVIKLDPSTGKFTNNRGEDRGSISEDGTIESIHIGTLKLEAKDAGVYGMEYKIKYDGKVIGNLNSEGFCAGYMVGPYTGAPSRLLAAYVYYALLFDKRMYTIKEKGYDPELKYTVEMLEDKIEWKNASAEGEVMEYESSRPYAGFDREEHPELRNCKVAAVGLTSDWKESKYVHQSGSDYYGTTWISSISYWVVYELTDGRNIVAFNTLVKKTGHKPGTERNNHGWHEVSNWVRK